jgi:REP element-mobilizing transposase RayT
MARFPRIQYEGALYHVINRGNYRAAVFQHPATAAAFERSVFEAVQLFGWQLLAFVIMRNHFHLVLETPRPNLVEGMHWLETTFSVRFNRFRKEHGHVFQGRYTALLIEPGPWLLKVVNYVHLNPVRARLLPVEQLATYPRCSYRLFPQNPRPEGLAAGWLRELGLADDEQGWKAYRQFLEWQAAGAGSGKEADAELTKGWAIGSPEWRQLTRHRHRAVLGRHRLKGPQLLELKMAEWSDALQSLLAASGRSTVEAARERKGAAWKIQIAWQLRHTSTATNAWIARELHMGTRSSVSVYLAQFRKAKEPRPGDPGS